MLAHLVGRTHAEGRMLLAQRDKARIVVEHLRITLQVVPVEAVDGVGRTEGVVHSLLVAQHFLASKNERNALRCEHGCLCKKVETNEFVVADVRDACTQTVGEAHVVVAAYIGHHLRRLVGPGRLRVVHLCHVYLRMAYRSGNAKLDALLLARHSCKETALCVIRERTAQGIAHFVAEGSNAIQLACVGLHGKLLLGISARACAPALTIYIY